MDCRTILNTIIVFSVFSILLMTSIFPTLQGSLIKPSERNSTQITPRQAEAIRTLENSGFTKGTSQDWQWAISAGGPGYDYGSSIVVDSNGNLYITGFFFGSATFGNTTFTGLGGMDVFVAKLDTNGVWQWVTTAGGPYDDFGYSVAVDKSGYVYITGSFEESAFFGSTLLTTQGLQDIFVAKLDMNGTWQWAKSAGGPSNDKGLSIATDGKGNSYITGYFFYSALFGTTNLTSHGYDDVFIAKLDTNGSWQWAINIGGIESDEGKGITVDGSGNTYITGFFEVSATFGTKILYSKGGYDVFVAKLDVNGAWLWATSAGGNSTDEGKGIAMDADGSIYITGRFWESATFGATILNGRGDFEVFVAKLNTTGAWQWATSAGGRGDDEAYSIAADAEGNTYVTGYFVLSATFGTTTLTGLGYYDAFVAMLDTNGTFLKATNVIGTGDVEGWGIAVDADSNPYIIGLFGYTAKFGNITLTYQGGYDVFVAKLKASFSPPVPFHHMVLLGVIANKTAYESVTSFNAVLVYYSDKNSSSQGILVKGEEVIISKDNQKGYFGKRIIIGTFDGIIEKP